MPVIVPWVGSTSLVIETGMTGAPATFERLLRNLRFNDLLIRVDARSLAVGATEGSVRFTAGRDTTNRAVSLLPSPSQETTVEVPLTSLDQLLREAPPCAPCCWKLIPPPCSAPWNRPASPATATTSSAARSAPRVAPDPPAATTSSGSGISPSCRRAAGAGEWDGALDHC